MCAKGQSAFKTKNHAQTVNTKTYHNHQEVIKATTHNPTNGASRIPARHQLVAMKPIPNVKRQIGLATSAGIAHRVWDKNRHKHKRAKQRKEDSTRENVISRQHTVQKERVPSFRRAVSWKMMQQDEDGPQRQASIDEQPLPKRAAALHWEAIENSETQQFS